MQTFQGLAVSDGLTVGPVVRIDRGAAGLHRIVCDPFRERAQCGAGPPRRGQCEQQGRLLSHRTLLIPEKFACCPPC